AVVIAYSVLTDGCDLPVSIWETMLAETPTSRASPRTLTPRFSRSSRSRRPSRSTSGAAIAPSSVSSTRESPTPAPDDTNRFTWHRSVHLHGVKLAVQYCLTPYCGRIYGYAHV